MTPTLAALVLYAFATGIFAVLSALERPVHRLMWDHAAPVPEGEVRRIHAALKGFIHILPPIMMTTMALALAMLLWQLAARGDAWGGAVLAAFVALQGAISPTLLRRIAAVKAQGSDSPLGEVRRDTARLAAVHHMGMGVTVAMTVLLLLTLLLSGG